MNGETKPDEKPPGNANLPIGAPRWHSRGYLPHFDAEGTTQHVTFHLADSLPTEVLERFQQEIRLLPEEIWDAERRKRAEAWIDAGHGSCLLRNPEFARMTQNSFLNFDAQRYRLLAWVVMPNHVHVLFQPINGWPVAKIVASWKKFTARGISDALRIGAKLEDVERGANREIGVPRVWHHEYWDRYIRDERHFRRTIEYIQQNPVKAGLADLAEAWPWSSAYPGNAGLGHPPNA